MNARAKVSPLGPATRGLKRISDELRHKRIVDSTSYQSGVIAFQPGPTRDGRKIAHADKDVVCCVLKGRGRLQLARRRIPLAPGTICHIPRGTPHDFSAAGGAPLFLLYTLIETGR